MSKKLTPKQAREYVQKMAKKHRKKKARNRLKRRPPTREELLRRGR